MRFIVIDGLDGSGKDTQALKLKEYLSKDGENIVLRVHPSQDNAFGRRVQKSAHGRRQADADRRHAVLRL